jgi:HK97 gp10 family phage protein
VAKGFTIEARGLKELKKKFGKIPENVANEVDGVLAYGANEFVNRAVNDAPVDQSELRQKISAKREAVMWHEVVSGAEHSAWVEWGTRSRVQVPAELQSYAAQFKGGGGKKGAKQAIYEWCRRNGIPEEAWFSIYKKIMTVGITPQPFFFKQVPAVQAAVQKKLQPAIRKALDK